MAKTPVECPVCGQLYKSDSSFKCHLRYDKNIDCLIGWQKRMGLLSTIALPQKRPLEEADVISFEDNVSLVDSTKNIPCDTEAEEDEYNFPMINDDSSCDTMEEHVCDDNPFSCDTIKESACDDNPFWSDDDEVESIGTEVPNEDMDISPTRHQISPDTGIIPAGHREGTAHFRENLWWPESSDLTKRQYLEDFSEFCEHTRWNTIPFQGGFGASVELLCLISKKRVPFTMYEDMYSWHLRNSREKSKKWDRGTAMEELEKRYYQENSKPFERVLSLPHSKVEISLPSHRFEAQLVSLLTDPRIKPEDYLFIDGDPRKLVPDNLDYVGDLNTGRSYRSAEKEWIKDPSRQKLVPLLFYLDGATITNCNGLTMCALKFTLGIFNAKTRDKAFAWRVLGYLPKIPKGKGKLQPQELGNSLHVDAEEVAGKTRQKDAVAEASTTEDFSDTDEKSQQFHAMLDVLLKDVVEYMKDDSRNIVWLLGGKYLMELVMYVELVKGDSAEADKHCGKYQSRAGNVKHLCRFCHVPNAKTDDPYASYPLKTEAGIQALVDRKDFARLQGISQHLIHNSWYKLRFSPHCPESIHRCTPLDILHWLQINKFTYIVSCFYEQTGEDSQFIKEIERIAASMGPLFQRQSEAAAQRTSFPRGLKPPCISGHHRSGILLVLLTVLRSSKGRHIIDTYAKKYDRYKKHFGKKQQIQDWIRLLELYIMLETWLRREKVLVSDVELLRTKMRKLMSHEKQVCKRDSGMQFRTFNFHAAIHIPDHMLSFGVMGGYNCESNEMHHKEDKTDALRTQKRESKFDFQLAKNIHGRTTLQYAAMEMKENLKVCQFFDREWKIPSESTNSQAGIRPDGVGGLHWTFSFKDPETGEYDIKLKCDKKKQQQCTPHKELVEYLEEKLDEMKEYVPAFRLYTSLSWKGITYRACQDFMEGPWRDWVMASMPGHQDEEIPCHIWAFLDLSSIPAGSPTSPGIYMIVETTRKSMWPQEKNLGELFQPFIKNTTVRDGSTRVFRDYTLVDITCITGPAIVIPDLSNKVRNTCLRLLPKSQWSSTFESWLRS